MRLWPKTEVTQNPQDSVVLVSTLATQTRDVLIILSAFGVLCALGVFVVNHYSDAKDASSVLGVLVPAIAAIAGTAFGVAQGVKAGTAAGTVTAQAAQAETNAVRTHTERAANDLDDLRSNLQPVMDAAGTTKQALSPEQLAEATTKLNTLEKSLRAALK